MPKTKISEYSSTPSNNTDVNGINIAEGCAPSGINNAIRQLMADLKNQQAGTSGDPFTVGGNLTVVGTTTLGTATATTPVTSDNSANIATTAYVSNKIAASTSGLSDPGGPGIVSRTATTGATVARSIQAGTGITVSNGDGVSGNPTISLNTSGVVTSVNGATGAVSAVSSVDGSTGAVALSSLSAFNRSTGANGFQRLPGGLIIQWGTSTAANAVITFPTAFSTACYSFVANNLSIGDVGGQDAAIALKSAPTTTGVELSNLAYSGLYWMAIGV